MQLSIWMIEEALDSYQTERHITEETPRSIDNIRLYTKGSPILPDTLYVEKNSLFFENGNDEVICVHKNNYLLVHDASVSVIFNQVLQFFEEMQKRERSLNLMLTSGCMLKDVLNHFQEMLPLPIMVLDNGQIMLAHSEIYGSGALDGEWDFALETGSFHLDKLEQYNQKHFDKLNCRGNYRITDQPFPYDSINRNIYIDDEFVGFISLLLIKEDKEVYLDWFDIACEAIQSWISLYMQQNEILLRQEAFEELIRGDFSHIRHFTDAMHTAGWKKNDRKQILAAACISDVLNMNQHIVNILNRNPQAVYAIEYQNEILILWNSSRLSDKAFYDTVVSILQKNGYYGGLSDIFTDYTRMPEFFGQARTTLLNTASYPGNIRSVREHMIPFMAEVLKKNSDIDLRHPGLEILKQYDKRHDSDLYQVLKVYLRNFCSQSETARALFIHRSTLFRKLEKIGNLIHSDLNDYETRLHLMMSYEMDDTQEKQ